MNIGDIQTRVARYLDRDDLDTDICIWCQDSREDISLAYNFHYLYKEASAAVVAGTNRYALPDDYLDHLRLFYINKKLGRVEPGIFDDMVGLTTTSSAGSGDPEYYVFYGQDIQVSPTPNAACVADGGYLKIKYYSAPASLSADANEDYMCKIHYDTIIYGTCVRASLFLNDQTNLGKWSNAFDISKDIMLKREKEREATDNKARRMRHWSDYDPDMMKRVFIPEGGKGSESTSDS